MNFEISAQIKRINRLYGPYTRETASSDNYIVRGRTSMLQLYVQLCKFVYVGTGSKVPVPGQKYRFNREIPYKLVHM